MLWQLQLGINSTSVFGNFLPKLDKLILNVQATLHDCLFIISMTKLHPRSYCLTKAQSFNYLHYLVLFLIPLGQLN